MTSGADPQLVLGPFCFRIEPGDVRSYRDAVGVSGPAVPASLAARALSSDAVLVALKKLLGTRIPVYHGQDLMVEQPLCAGADYACEFRLFQVGQDSLRLEQRLWDSEGRLCLTLTSMIGMAGT